MHVLIVALFVSSTSNFIKMSYVWCANCFSKLQAAPKKQICFSFRPLSSHLEAKSPLLNVIYHGFKTCLRHVMVLITEDDVRRTIASPQVQLCTLFESSTGQPSIRADGHMFPAGTLTQIQPLEERPLQGYSAYISDAGVTVLVYVTKILWASKVNTGEGSLAKV